MLTKKLVKFNQLLIVIMIFILASCKSNEYKQPNFIVIFDDQHNSKFMGWTGKGEGIKTPNLDRLASESIAFVNGYSNYPVCAPARHSFYTGQYASKHGVIYNDTKLNDSVPTVMKLLSDGGYTTANVGKMHFSPYNSRHGFQYVLNHEFFDNSGGISHFRPWLEREVKKRDIKAARYPQWIQTKKADEWIYSANSLGFEYDLPVELTSEHWVTDNSIAFIENQLKERPDKPFFLHASYFAPHHPYGVTKEFDTYNSKDMKIPPSWNEQNAKAFDREEREKKGYQEFSKEEYQILKAKYFGFITQLDFEIGRLLDFIEKDPELSRNTIIIFVSDHGDRMGEHGMLFKGFDGAMLEGSVAIPFMIKWPGQVPRIEKNPVSHIDLMPTILSAAKIKTDINLPGQDLKELVKTWSTNDTWSERVVISEWLDPLPFRYLMARKGKYKFVAENSNNGIPLSEMQYSLYDMEEDVWEMKNLASNPKYENIVSQFKVIIMNHYNQQKPFLPKEKPPVVPRSDWNIKFPFKPWEKTEKLR